MSKCTYCNEPATREDAMGIPTCSVHEHECDDYFRQRFGREPSDDDFLYCKEHIDLWQSGCARCEACCQHHYGMTVKERFGNANTPEERGVRFITLEPGEL